MERGRETATGLRRAEEGRGRRSEAAMSRRKEERRAEQWRDLSLFSCALLDQVAQSIRPQNLLRTRGKARGEGEIKVLVLQTFVHVSFFSTSSLLFSNAQSLLIFLESGTAGHWLSSAGGSDWEDPSSKLFNNLRIICNVSSDNQSEFYKAQ